VTLLAIFLLSASFGQRFYNQPGLDVKSVAPQTFYVPETVVFEDKHETERRRNDVRDGVIPMLRLDDDLTDEATRSLKMLLQQGRELRAQAGSPPFINLQVLSRLTQDYLFQASDEEWNTIWRLAEAKQLSSNAIALFAATTAETPTHSESLSPANDSADSSESSLENIPERSLRALAARSPKLAAQLRSFRLNQIAALQELVAYRELSGDQGLAQLKVRINTPRQQYRKAAAELARAASTEGQPLYNYRLLS